MNKLITIALKDVTLAFRDRAALILMLAAPLALTVGLGVVTGRFSGNTNTGVSDIPVAVVNQDDGQLGRALANVFTSPDVGTLVQPITMTTADAARKQVDDNKAAAAVIIPAGFTSSIIPNSSGQATTATVELRLNPTRPVGAGVVQSIVETFLSRVEASRVGGQVAIEQLVRHQLLQPQDVTAAAQAFGERQATDPSSSQTIVLERATATGAPPPTFDPLAYLAPGMALLFLMFTVTRGGSKLLAERDGGTLARLFISPTPLAQILGGKVAGIFLTALAQVGLLVIASTMFFGLRWGDWLGLVLLVPAVALAATGWGLLLTSLVKTPQQAGSVGTAAMLLFGVVGGSFGNFALPDALQTLGKITPNAWGIQGFAALASGGNVADVGLNVVALLVIAAVTFAVAVFMFSRNGFVRK